MKTISLQEMRQSIFAIKEKPGSAAYLKEFLAIIDSDIGLKLYGLDKEDYSLLQGIASEMITRGRAKFYQYQIFEFLKRRNFDVCLNKTGYEVTLKNNWKEAKNE